MEKKINQRCDERCAIVKAELRGSHAAVVTNHLNAMIQRQMNAVIYARPECCHPRVFVKGDDIFSPELEITIDTEMHGCERELPTEAIPHAIPCHQGIEDDAQRQRR